MRTLASLSAVTLAIATLAACGLSVGGLADGLSDGGLGDDGHASTEGSASSSGAGGSGSSSGSSSGGSSSSGSASSSGGSSSGADAAPGDSTTGSDATGDVSTDDVVNEPPPQETSPTCTVAGGCYVIPGGWQFVAFAPTQGSACPSGFAASTPFNVEEGPSTAAACSCAQCSNDQPPTCESGAVAVSFDTHTGGPAGNCGMAGVPAQNNNAPPGSCGTDLYKGGALFGSYKGLDLEYTPANTLGGHCTSAGVAGTVPFATPDRICPPDSAAAAGCSGNQCTPTIPSPYLACIVQSGAQTCPAGSAFTQSHTVGTGFTGLTCSACACNPTGTCSGGTMKLFTDGNCMDNEQDIKADGQCHDSNAGSDGYGSYKYVANAPGNVSCTVTGGSSPTGGSLTNEQTVCCVP